MPSEYNPQLIENMSAKFRRLNNPAHAMADAIGMLQMFPGVVGIWPGGVSGGGGANQNMMVDISGNALHLTRNGTTLFRNDNLIADVAFDGSTGYYSHADASIFDITGTGGHVGGDIRGLTLGAWVKFDNAASATETVLSKWNSTGGNLSYSLIRRASGEIRFRISNDGSASVTVDSVATIAADTWVFVAGVFEPSTSLNVWLNGTEAVNTTSIPASIFSGNGSFGIGADPDAPGNYFDGRLALAWLTQTAVPDIFIDTYFQMTAPLFGVAV